MHYKVRINESSEGMSLKELESRIIEYMGREKTTQPRTEGGASLYELRSGLSVAFYPSDGRHTIDMRVSGEMEIFGNSINSILKIYSGHLEIIYMQFDNGYKSKK